MWFACGYTHLALVLFKFHSLYLCRSLSKRNHLRPHWKKRRRKQKIKPQNAMREKTHYLHQLEYSKLRHTHTHTCPQETDVKGNGSSIFFQQIWLQTKTNIYRFEWNQMHHPICYLIIECVENRTRFSFHKGGRHRERALWDRIENQPAHQQAINFVSTSVRVHGLCTSKLRIIYGGKCCLPLSVSRSMLSEHYAVGRVRANVRLSVDFIYCRSRDAVHGVNTLFVLFFASCSMLLFKFIAISQKCNQWNYLLISDGHCWISNRFRFWGTKNYYRFHGCCAPLGLFFSLGMIIRSSSPQNKILSPDLHTTFFVVGLVAAAQCHLPLAAVKCEFEACV